MPERRETQTLIEGAPSLAAGRAEPHWGEAALEPSRPADMWQQADDLALLTLHVESGCFNPRANAVTAPP